MHAVAQPDDDDYHVLETEGCTSLLLRQIRRFFGKSRLPRHAASFEVSALTTIRPTMTAEMIERSLEIASQEMLGKTAY